MTPAEEQALVREMQALADAVTDVLNKAPSLTAAPAGIAREGLAREQRINRAVPREMPSTARSRLQTSP